MREYCVIFLGLPESVKMMCKHRGFDLACVKVQETLDSGRALQTSRVIIKDESLMDARIGQTRRRIQQWHAEGEGLIHWFQME